MAVSGPQTTWTAYAGADLTGQQYRYVKYDSSGNFIPITAANDNAVGVLQNAPESGQEATVAISGITKIRLGGAGRTRGQYIKHASDGRAVAGAADGSDASGKMIIGAGANNIGTASINLEDK